MQSDRLLFLSPPYDYTSHFPQMRDGGIKQFFGSGPEAHKCHHCPPTSNADYGSGEQPLLFTGNEPLTGCLYSLNFALIGLREATGATGEHRYAKAENALVDYLLRIQVSSDKHAELDGAWFRAFDFEKWEYWGSDGDWGYGPWVTDNGWTNGWIMTALAARQANTTLWDVMGHEAEQWEEEELKRICHEMLGDLATSYCETARRHS